jgi:hypothetical protein
MKEQILTKVNAIADPFRKSRMIEDIAFSFAGPANKDNRQRLLFELTGTTYPKAKAGVHEIIKAIKELTTP